MSAAELIIEELRESKKKILEAAKSLSYAELLRIESEMRHNLNAVVFRVRRRIEEDLLASEVDNDPELHHAMQMGALYWVDTIAGCSYDYDYDAKCPTSIFLLWRKFYLALANSNEYSELRERHVKSTGMMAMARLTMSSAVRAGYIGDKTMFRRFLDTVHRMVAGDPAKYQVYTHEQMNKRDRALYSKHPRNGVFVNSMDVPVMDRLTELFITEIPMQMEYFGLADCVHQGFGRPFFRYGGIEFKEKAAVKRLINPQQQSRKAQANNAKRYKHTQYRDAKRKEHNERFKK